MIEFESLKVGEILYYNDSLNYDLMCTLEDIDINEKCIILVFPCGYRLRLYSKNGNMYYVSRTTLLVQYLGE